MNFTTIVLAILAAALIINFWWIIIPAMIAYAVIDWLGFWGCLFVCLAVVGWVVKYF